MPLIVATTFATHLQRRTGSARTMLGPIVQVGRQWEGEKRVEQVDGLADVEEIPDEEIDSARGHCPKGGPILGPGSQGYILFRIPVTDRDPIEENLPALVGQSNKMANEMQEYEYVGYKEEDIEAGKEVKEMTRHCMMLNRSDHVMKTATEAYPGVPPFCRPCACRVYGQTKGHQNWI